ncbi:MAG: hypothetical protein F4Z83_05380 [Gemmatimonadetes bacterium]|nr:hypothetical protein [Gemmatimonadota bacterium]
MIEVLNDEYLLVGDAAGNLHLGVVDIGRGTMMARFGSHGEGPREFQGPHRVARDPASDDTWWVYDFPSWTWTPVTMQGDASSWSIGERYSMEGMPPVPETPVWIGENEALVHGMFADFAMARVTFDRNRRVTNWNPVEVPLPFKDLPEPGKRQLNRSFVAVRPSGGFAVAFQYDNEIELRDEHGLLTSRVTGPREVTPDYFFDDEGRFHWGENDDNGYIGAYGTERAFYLLWCGGAECPTMAIHQFDWDGNLVREFGISGVLAFAVSSNDDRMWGFMHENIPPLIGEWDLSN